MTVPADDPLTRPPTPPGFDPSRAAERAAEPTGWRYPDTVRSAIYRVIAERRDIRRFRPDAIPAATLERVLNAAHQAPSVGLMQPWRIIVVRDPATRSAVRRLAQRERLRQADRFNARARHFLDQKIEGVVEAPLGLVICCDHGDADVEVLGRGTIPETDVYSTACAIENLWLAARAEGLGVGWVSFYRPPDLRALLDIPPNVDPIAYLCLGWPDERPSRPGLETAGWAKRMALSDVVIAERWQSGPDAPTPTTAADRTDRSAAIAARDRSDRLVKPTGSLGTLEPLIERWASITSATPPTDLRAAVLVCAADHGHVIHGTSLFDAEVSGQVARAAARGNSAVGVLARAGGHPLLVADVGLAGPTPVGVRAAKIATGSADMLAGPALDEQQVDAALATGTELTTELITGQRVDCLILGEIGIGNTTTTATLAAMLTGATAKQTVGRGTGMDAEGLRRKRAVVEQALTLHGPQLDGRAAAAAVGGLELVALAGAAIEAARRRLPVLLDGYATTVAALLATRIDAAVVDVLIAGHRSAELGHELVLAELGIEPLLDLRLRLGEASGALLALPLIAAAGRLHREMATYEEAGVARRL